MRNRISLALLFIGCMYAASAQLNSSVLSQGSWYFLETSSDDAYVLDGDLLYRDMQLSAPIPFATLGLFSSSEGPLQEENSARRAEGLQELPTHHVDENNNGLFDQEDAIVFYSHGPHDWMLESGEVSLNFNHYSDVAGFFFTPDQGSGLQATQVTSISSTTTVGDYDFLAFWKEDDVNLYRSGRRWLSNPVTTTNSSMSWNLDLSNKVNAAPLTVALRVASASESNANTQLRLNGQSISNLSLPPLGNGTYRDVVRTASTSITTTASSVPSTFQLTYSTSDPQGKGYLEDMICHTRKDLIPSNGRLRFRDVSQVQSGGSATYDISVSSGTPWLLWDVTVAYAPFSIETSQSGSSLAFGVATDSLREFLAFDPSQRASFPRPSYVGTVSNQNLRGIASTDMVIVTSSAMRSAAETLANHREQGYGLDVEVVTIDQVYNEFSSGQADLSAVRDFMRMLYKTAPSPEELPQYLLLLGDASFDPKNRVSSGSRNIVLTYESPESFSPLQTYATDDFYGFLDDDEGSNIATISQSSNLDIAIGRLPVATSEEAMDVVEKIIDYDEGGHFGDWRNRVTFVADDEDNELHMRDADELADWVRLNQPSLNVDKIYLDAFAQVNAAGGDRYPSVNEAIDRQLFKGSLIVNYTGHGGPENWAQERVFNREDMAELTNSERLPFFITATCDFSVYDDPDEITAGEVLITNPNGGAIALVTTSRLVFSSSNRIINNSYIENLLPVGGSVPSIGEALRLAKNAIPQNANNRKFTLLGDPCTRLAIPKYSIHTVAINGNPPGSYDTLKALSEVTIQAEVRDENDMLLTSFSGLAIPSVYDKVSDLSTRANDPDTDIFTYQAQQNLLFKGQCSVNNGQFTFSFIVPKDINYAIGEGKLSYYASPNTGIMDAAGYDQSVLIGGSSENPIVDNEGPQVEVFMNDASFQFGGLTDANPTLCVKLRDESGLNTVGNGIGHDIIGALDNNTQAQFVLNDFFKSALDSFTQGEVYYPLSNLEDGRHSIRVRAWDVSNNSGEGYTEFVVVSAPQLAIEHLLNAPNPVMNSTSFLFEFNNPGEAAGLEASIEIFNAYGERVQTLVYPLSPLEGYRVAPGELTWDGRDASGAPLARGTYLYRLQIIGSDGRKAEACEKLVLLR
ncbi:MAG: type IX secretion system sortase PorU [Bacteroidota bacterium]|nr:type IX secretion system sortase PorU [Bacteroidota bacterium]